MHTILLLHGALGHSNQFDTLKQRLEQNNFTVYTLLFDGHGDNVLTTEDISIAYYTQQLNNFLASNNLQDIIVFGYSLGGYVAINHAILFPNKIKSIITLATKFNWSPDIALRETKMLNPDVIKEKVPQYATQLATLHGEENWQNLLRAIALLMTDLGNQNLLSEQQISTLNIPIQYMVGDKDAMVTVAETIEKFQQTPNASLAVLPDTKHPFEKVGVDLLFTLIVNFAKKN